MSVTPTPPPVRRVEAPSALRDRQAWLIWRYESEPGTTKRLKVPYWAAYGKRFGRQGTERDRERLVTFAEAKEAAVRRGFEGVGLAMLAGCDLVALDFDKCVGPNNTLPPEVEAIASSTYAELSPSGTGVRAFFKGDLGNRKSLGPDQPFGMEVFSSTGFVTFTGDTLPYTEALGLEDTVADIPDTVVEMCRQRFGASPSKTFSNDPFDTFEPALGMTDPEIEAYLSDLDPDGPRDEWIRVGMAVHHETQGDGFHLWDAWSTDGVKYPGSEALELQWQSFDRRAPEGRQITMRTVIKLSNAAREKRGEEARGFDPVQRAAQITDVSESPEDLFATPEDWDGKFKIWSKVDFANRPAPGWIIKGVLPKADLGVIYGASGSGKSFVVLDIALAICRGIAWRSRKTVKGRVLYVAAEGADGVSQRLKAYDRKNDTEGDQLPLGILHGAPNLLVEKDATELVRAIIAAGGGDLIIIDTLAQTTAGGNENSGEDMGLALKHARSIGEATGAMVLLVHHSGKDVSRGMRGWSGIKGAADVEIEVVRPEEGDVRIVRISKQKDGRDDIGWGFKLEEVILGIDDDGDEMTSLVVTESDLPKEPEEAKATGPKEQWDLTTEDYVAFAGAGESRKTARSFVEGVAGTQPKGSKQGLQASVLTVHSTRKLSDAGGVLVKEGSVEIGADFSC